MARISGRFARRFSELLLSGTGVSINQVSTKPGQLHLRLVERLAVRAVYLHSMSFAEIISLGI